jgi:CHRD domain
VPVNASTATGSMQGVFDKATNVLSLTFTYTGLTATNMHIHKGPAGVSGGVLFGLATAPFTSPVSYSSPVLSTGQVDSLMNNLYYINIHSAAFPAGEIRGQITKQ